MRYAGIIYNDFTAGPGVCLTFFVQGCSHHCKGCYNPETWDFDGGREFSEETLSSIIEGLTANGITRNLAIMGGEPLDPENLFLTGFLISQVRSCLPQVKIYLWTGYTYEEIKDSPDMVIRSILGSIDLLIDGPFIEDLKDLRLPMRGSSNQRIIKFNHEVEL